MKQIVIMIIICIYFYLYIIYLFINSILKFNIFHVHYDDLPTRAESYLYHTFILSCSPLVEMEGPWIKDLRDFIRYQNKLNHSIISLGMTSCLLKYILEDREYDNTTQRLYGPVGVSYHSDYLNPRIDYTELDSDILNDVYIIIVIIFK